MYFVGVKFNVLPCKLEICVVVFYGLNIKKIYYYHSRYQELEEALHRDDRIAEHTDTGQNHYDNFYK